MSKMGQFVFSVQEIVCDNYNEPFAVVKEKVLEEFNGSTYAVEIARQEYDQIFSDIEEFEQYMLSEGS